MGGAIKKVMFLGRVTTFVVGLAMILAISVGVASTALAGTGVLTLATGVLLGAGLALSG